MSRKETPDPNKVRYGLLLWLDDLWRDFRFALRSLVKMPGFTAACAADLKDKALQHAREALEIRDPMSQFFFSKLHPASARLLAESRFHEIPVDMGWLLK